MSISTFFRLIRVPVTVTVGAPLPAMVTFVEWSVLVKIFAMDHKFMQTLHIMLTGLGTTPLRCNALSSCGEITVTNYPQLMPSQASNATTSALINIKLKMF